jgi:SAM-dependent methyltransferase
MTRTLHPFPARMAPDVAVAAVQRLTRPGKVLDPMCGSGTTLAAAAELGHSAFGCDVDPLAILLARAATTPLRGSSLRVAASRLVDESRHLRLGNLCLPWLDTDPEALAFVRYWFAPRQRHALRKLAFLLYDRRGAAAQALRVVFSRLIIAKNSGASLARDVSHSRPHRVADRTEYDVLNEFLVVAERVSEYLDGRAVTGRVSVVRRDARRLPRSMSNQIDLVVTSPPYLNAIDYMRGHRLSLIWLGYSLSRLRQIRATSIGSERSITLSERDATSSRVLRRALPDLDCLPARTGLVLERYAHDVQMLMAEVSRVLRPGGEAVVVIGDTSVKRVHIPNSGIVSGTAACVGLKLVGKRRRQLPDAHRYLPPPSSAGSAQLGARTRTEVVLRFRRTR